MLILDDKAGKFFGSGRTSLKHLAKGWDAYVPFSIIKSNKDMRELNIYLYPNLLPGINLTATEVERQIAQYKLTFSPLRNPVVEWASEFPMFLPSFYRYVIAHQSVPSQEDFWNLYLTDNSMWFQGEHPSDEVMLSLKARAFRAYPSFVRDLHFCLMLRASAKYADVIYNTDLDIINGIDVLLSYAGKLYAINLFTETENAQIGRTKKQFRHTPFDNIVYIELPVSFKGSKACGNFYLYSEREMEVLNKKLN